MTMDFPEGEYLKGLVVMKKGLTPANFAAPQGADPATLEKPVLSRSGHGYQRAGL